MEINKLLQAVFVTVISFTCLNSYAQVPIDGAFGIKLGVAYKDPRETDGFMKQELNPPQPNREFREYNVVIMTKNGVSRVIGISGSTGLVEEDKGLCFRKLNTLQNTLSAKYGSRVKNYDENVRSFTLQDAPEKRSITGACNLSKYQSNFFGKDKGAYELTVTFALNDEYAQYIISEAAYKRGLSQDSSGL